MSGHFSKTDSTAASKKTRADDKAYVSADINTCFFSGKTPTATTSIIVPSKPPSSSSSSPTTNKAPTQQPLPAAPPTQDLTLPRAVVVPEEEEGSKILTDQMIWNAFQKFKVDFARKMEGQFERPWPGSGRRDSLNEE